MTAVSFFQTWFESSLDQHYGWGEVLFRLALGYCVLCTLSPLIRMQPSWPDASITFGMGCLFGRSVGKDKARG